MLLAYVPFQRGTHEKHTDVFLNSNCCKFTRMYEKHGFIVLYYTEENPKRDPYFV